MSKSTLILAELQALAALGDYGGVGIITPSTAVLGLSAALFLSDLTIWRGAGSELTDAEIDDIDEIIAQLECDLMTIGDSSDMEKCKVTTLANITVPASANMTLLFDDELYDTDDMHSVAGANWRVYVKSDGLHLLTAGVKWDVSSVGNRKIWIAKGFEVGGPSVILRTDIHSPPAVPDVVTQSFSIHDNALAGDYYWITVRQTSPLPLDIIQDDSSPMLSVARLL